MLTLLLSATRVHLLVAAARTEAHVRPGRLRPSLYSR
jgi:hypothetical protein